MLTSNRNAGVASYVGTACARSRSWKTASQKFSAARPSWGRGAPDHPLASAYHKLLVWDIMRKPAVTQWADQVLNPLIGKSLVVYAAKPAQAVTRPRPAAAEKVHAAA